MSMFQITGQVINCFFQPGNLDKTTGELKEGKNKVQILGNIPVSDGGSKMDLVTLTVPDGIDFKAHLQKRISVPLGFFAPAKGSILYFIPKGAKITPLNAA